MIDPWDREKTLGANMTLTVNCPKSGHITPLKTNVNTLLVKDLANPGEAEGSTEWSGLVPFVLLNRLVASHSGKSSSCDINLVIFKKSPFAGPSFEY